MADITALTIPNKDEMRALRQELVAKAELARAAGADEGPRLALREFLEEHPELWRYAGDLVKYTEVMLLKPLKPNLLVYESVLRGQTELRTELGYETAPALERPLIELVVLYYLRWRLAELRLGAVTEGETDDPAIRRLEEQAGTAQVRYLRACETLARIRRLARRTPDLVQINIAAQQMNVAETGGGID